MFPIRSKRGKVLAFTARVLPGNDWGPKYMNSPDTPIFHKKENLFGQYESRQEIRKSDLAIICEGSTDVISAHQHNIKNIVAPLGTGLTEEQLENLSKITKNFLFFFDSDDAGKKALIRAFKIASELKLVPYATTPEPYKDIDELLQEDPAKMKKLIKNKREAFFFILEDFLADKNLNKLEDLDKVRNFIGLLLFSVKDSDVKKYYSDKAASITKITSLRHRGFDSRKTTRKNSNTKLRVKVADNKLYREYLQRLLLLDTVKKEFLVEKELLEESNLKEVYIEILNHYQKGKEKLYSNLHNNTEVAKTFEDIIFDLTDTPTDKDTIIKELREIMTKEAEKFLKELIDINNILKEKGNA